MNLGFHLPEQTAAAEHAEMLLKTDVDREKVFLFLRSRGMSKMDSMRIFADATGTPLLEAMKIVQRSPVWR